LPRTSKAKPAAALRRIYARTEKKFVQAGGAPVITPDISSRFYHWTTFDTLLLQEFFRYSDSLPPHPLEKDELFYDRLLLHSSENYLLTRKLADRFSLRLESEAISQMRSYMEFNPFSQKSRYTPMRSELQWLLCSQKKQATPATATQNEITSLLQFSNSHYHDLNQMILARLIRPLTASTSSAKDRCFHYFLESLTQMRDIDLSEELGDCRIHFARTGSIYSSPNFASPRASIRRSWQTFHSGFFCFYMVTRDGSQKGYREARALFQKNNLEWIPHPYFEVSPFFVDKIVPAWLSQTQGRLPKTWPRPPAAFQKSIQKIPLIPAEKLVRETGLFQDLFHWYRELFPLSDIRL
jgi:hypothetical protein